MSRKWFKKIGDKLDKVTITRATQLQLPISSYYKQYLYSLSNQRLLIFWHKMSLHLISIMIKTQQNIYLYTVQAHVKSGCYLLFLDHCYLLLFGKYLDDIDKTLISTNSFAKLGYDEEEDVIDAVSISYYCRVVWRK